MKTLKFYCLAPIVLPFFLLGSIGVETIFKLQTFFKNIE